MRHPDITVSRAAHGQSEEVAASVGDTIAELRTALERAQADAVALRHKIEIALPTISAFKDSYLDAVAEHLEVAIAAEHPGASLQAELAAARAIVEEFRWSVIRCGCPTCTKRRALYAAYDAAVQVRKR